MKFRIEGVDEFAASVKRGADKLDRAGANMRDTGNAVMGWGMKLMGFGILALLGIVLFVWLAG